ncbi:hypothetical protein OHR68_09785 [Spirillospora sp. NBC_00431]
MTDQHIPPHAHGLMLAAAQEAHNHTRWTVREQDLSKRYGDHQAWADTEKTRIRAELEKAAAAAQATFDQIDATGKKLAADLADAARRKDQHAADAEEAQAMVLDWCARRGIDPATLPPVPVVDTGPLPAIGAVPESPRPPSVGQSQPLPLVAPPAPAEPSPLTTRVDPLPAGGEEPAPGPFPGGDAQGVDVAPRADGDGVTGDTTTEQDGDDQ